MLLHFKLNDEIDIEGTKYTVNASFDVILKVVELLQDTRISDVKKPSVALKLLIDDELKQYDFKTRLQLMESILSDYVQFEDDVKYDRLGNPVPNSAQEQAGGAQYSYTEDAELIFSAFMQAYGIDLIEQQGKLHWAKFKALLNGLPSETAFSNVLQIRGWSPAQDKEKYSTRMHRLKKQYKLKGKEEKDG